MKGRPTFIDLLQGSAQNLPSSGDSGSPIDQVDQSWPNAYIRHVGDLQGPPNHVVLTHGPCNPPISDRTTIAATGSSYRGRQYHLCKRSYGWSKDLACSATTMAALKVAPNCFGTSCRRRRQCTAASAYEHLAGHGANAATRSSCQSFHRAVLTSRCHERLEWVSGVVTISTSCIELLHEATNSSNI